MSQWPFCYSLSESLPLLRESGDVCLLQRQVRASWGTACEINKLPERKHRPVVYRLWLGCRGGFLCVFRVNLASWKSEREQAACSFNQETQKWTLSCYFPSLISVPEVDSFAGSAVGSEVKSCLLCLTCWPRGCRSACSLLVSFPISDTQVHGGRTRRARRSVSRIDPYWVTSGGPVTLKALFLMRPPWPTHRRWLFLWEMPASLQIGEERREEESLFSVSGWASTHLCSHASVRAKSLQSCLTLGSSVDCSARLFCPWDSPGRDTAVGCRALLQGIFLTQGWNHSVHIIWFNWQIMSSLKINFPEFKSFQTAYYTLGPKLFKVFRMQTAKRLSSFMVSVCAGGTWDRLGPLYIFSLSCEHFFFSSSPSPTPTTPHPFLCLFFSWNLSRLLTGVHIKVLYHSRWDRRSAKAIITSPQSHARAQGISVHLRFSELSGPGCSGSPVGSAIDLQPDPPAPATHTPVLGDSFSLAIVAHIF